MNYRLAHAEVLRRRGRLDEALRLVREARAVAELVPGRAHWTAVALAGLSVELDRPDVAAAYCAEIEAATGERRALLPILELWLLAVRARWPSRRAARRRRRPCVTGPARRPRGPASASPASSRGRRRRSPPMPPPAGSPTWSG